MKLTEEFALKYESLSEKSRQQVREIMMMLYLTECIDDKTIRNFDKITDKALPADVIKDVRCHYTAVIVDGKISQWTGPNPDKDRNSKIHALQREECYRSLGHNAYAIEVIQIKESDVK